MVGLKRLRGIVGLLAMLGVLPGQVCLSEAAAAAASDNPRQILPLAEGWRFALGDDVAGAERADFADTAWQPVTVPHSWNRVGYYLTSNNTPQNRKETVNLTQGVGWYRLSFVPSADLAGKSAWLQFDAASRTAEIWLNGRKLASHNGGFSRFRVNATGVLQPGQTNLLAVRVDNTQPHPGSDTADSLPLAGDFFVHGGLYRPVSLVITAPTAFDLADFGGPGIYGSTTRCDAQSATVQIRSKLRHDGGQPFAGTVTTRLLAADGSVAAMATSPVSLAPGQALTLSQDVSVPQPHRWQGVADPYLYRLQSELSDGNGRVIDRLEQSFGIREIRIDPNQGLFLNGQHVALHGVSRHQDRDGRGWALSAADEEQDIALIREIGANSIRLAHYQQSDHINDLADRAGLILWDEIPLVSKWTLATDQQNASDGLVANARQQLTELIRQHFNHAAVAVWGIANEVDFGVPVSSNFSMDQDGFAPDPTALLQQLNALAKSEDPGRPTTLAGCCEGYAPRAGAKPPIISELTDVTGANRYFGWYRGSAQMLAPHLDWLHASHPGTAFSVSEYGAGGALSQGTDDPEGGPPDARGRIQPEEYQSYVHEVTWAAISARPYLWDSWVWNMFDFATTVRKEGDSVDLNTKGLVTYDRATKKDAFYFYQANWTDRPVVHLAGRRHRSRDYLVNDIKVYSNAAETRLSINGRALAPQHDCPEKICVWPAVTLKIGDNRIEASGRFGQTAVKDVIHWQVEDWASRHLWIDSGALMGSDTERGRYGSDHFFEGGSADNVTRATTNHEIPVVRTVSGTDEPTQLATFRRGNFAYDIPLANGHYRVTLRFAEPDADQAGQRQFDVVANRVTRLAALDIASAAGGALKALDRNFEVEIATGRLRLDFRPVKGEAVVSAIEIDRLR